MTLTLTCPPKRRPLPIDQTAAGYTAGRPDAAREEWGGPALRIYDAVLARRWEVGRIEAMALKSEGWWLKFFAKERVPLDTALPIITDLIDWILVEQLSRLADPDAYAVAGGEDDEATVDPMAEGLTVRPLTTREKRPKPILPGCQRQSMIGGDDECPRLRRPTERLCPACAAEYLKSQRRLRHV